MSVARAAAAVGALLCAKAPAAHAVLLTGDLLCSVQPGYFTPSMPLRIQVETDRIVVSLPTQPPGIGYWRILDNNDVGIVASSGTAGAPRGFPAFASGSTFFILRSSGAVRWTESGADNQPVVDRAGTCVNSAGKP